MMVEERLSSRRSTGLEGKGRKLMLFEAVGMEGLYGRSSGLVGVQLGM